MNTDILITIHDTPFRIDFRRFLRILKLVIAIGVFFEPNVLMYMENYGFHASFARILSLVYSGMKVLISIYALILVFLNRIKIKGNFILVWLLVLYSVSMVIACCINGSASVSVLGNIFAQVGFVLLAYFFLENTPRDFHLASVWFFGLFSLASLLNVFLLPKGLFQSRDIDSTIYSAYFIFGGKNASFPYYCCFAIGLITYYNKWGKKDIKLLPLIFLFLLLIASVIRCQSASSSICLSLLFLVVVIMRYFPVLFKRMNPGLAITVISIIILIMYTGSLSSIYTNFLQSLGRNATLSSRTIIWKQAFDFIGQKPLFGVGTTARFVINELVSAGHAHSQYIDRLVKFGSISFVLFIGVIIHFFKSISLKKDWKMRNFIGLAVSIYFFHMAFDVYNFNFFLYLIILGVYVLKKGNGSLFIRST